MTVTGADKINKNYDKMMKQILSNVSNAMSDTVSELAENSAPLCPFDSGNLVSTLKAEVNGSIVAVGNSNRKAVRVGKGLVSKKYVITGTVSYDTEYAMVQHENMEFYHPTPGTQAKYLEQPFLSMKEKFKSNMKNAIRRVTK